MYITTPLGDLQMTEFNNKLISLKSIKENSHNFLDKQQSEMQIKLQQQMDEYFKKQRQKFDIQIEWGNYTNFQIQVLRETLKIPYGQTRSYNQIAKAINCKSARAVGSALNKNKHVLIIPCHRVIGSNGKLTGFGWGGIENKKILLDLESK